MNAKSVRKNEIDGLYEVVAATRKSSKCAANLATILVKFIDDVDLPVVVRNTRKEQFGHVLSEINSYSERMGLLAEGLVGQLKEVEARNKNLNELERMATEYNE